MAAAKSEAEAIVKEFKTDLESKHQADVNSQQGASTTEAAKLTNESDEQIKAMHNNYAAKKDELKICLRALLQR